MFALQPSHIYMQQVATDKTQALQKLCEILVKDGLVTSEYLQGLNDRENQSATYLGQGIAIPHGTPQSRQAILQTGVRVAHFPQGVVWGENGEIVYLAIVISAKSDEHLQVLQQLTRSLMSDIAEKIQQANQPEQIISLLNAQPPSFMLHEDLIATQAPAFDVEDLFFYNNFLLKKQQCVTSEFHQLLRSDALIHIGEGVWSITGEKYVLKPAVSIVTPEQPLQFLNKTLSMLICIASNDNMDMIQFHHFMDTLFSPAKRQQLQSCQEATEIAQLLGATVNLNWVKRSVILQNAHGLHARPATQLAKLAQAYRGDIQVSVNGGEFVSAKSLTKLLSLGGQRGQTLTLLAEPETDAVAGLEKIIHAVRDGLGEVVEPFVPQNQTKANSPKTTEPVLNLTFDEEISGTPASKGLAVGTAHVVKPPVFNYERFADNVATETQKLKTAIENVQKQLQKLISEAENKDIAQIFTAHLALLDDPDLQHQVNKKLMQGLSAPCAWFEHIDDLAKKQASLDNPLLAGRAIDLRDVGNRVLAQLCGVKEVNEPTDAYILIMDDVAPSDVARLNKNRVAGILTAFGGASGHSAIVARALGIPAIVGAGKRVLDIAQHTPLLINGDTGDYVINPDDAQISQAKQARQQAIEQRKQAQQHCLKPAITQDNHQVEVAGNIGAVQVTKEAVEQGAEAIGLLRTELIFMSYHTAPDIQTQELAYRQVFDALAGRPLVVRTLDVGGDKPLPYLPMPHEDNPFLGIRGIRLTLRQPLLLKQQLTALLKASDNRPLRIMFPMIARLEEWQQAKAILDEVRQDYPCENLQVGMMLEVPSSALLASTFAKEVDFFSIGTNDLTQYTLAIDRGHPVLSKEADGLHPSVLMLIDKTVQSAHQHGKWVGVCGELASDSQAVPILIGLGVDELSMSVTSIPLVKSQIRELNYQECQKLAQQALCCTTASEVRALIG